MSMQGEVRGGLISSVEVQKKDPTRVAVFIEGAFAFGLDVEIAARHGLRRGVTVVDEQISGAIREDGVLRAFHAALNLLSFTMRSEEEIRRRLARKGFDETAIDEAVRRLVETEYLNDRTLARQYVDARVRSRGEGLHRVRRNLLRRGVGREIVEDALAQLEPEVDWLELAREQAAKRWERLGTTADTRRRQKKLFDYLVRKGFDYDVARRVAVEFGNSSED